MGGGSEGGGEVSDSDVVRFVSSARRGGIALGRGFLRTGSWVARGTPQASVAFIGFATAGSGSEGHATGA